MQDLMTSIEKKNNEKLDQRHFSLTLATEPVPCKLPSNKLNIQHELKHFQY